MENISQSKDERPLSGSKLWNGVNVLMVEDSPTQAMILETLLKQKGCIVKTAANGEDALEYLKGFKPTIVISDVVMPGMNGYELCRSIKSHPEFKDVPVMLLTSLFDPVDVIKAIECGADNFLVKPCPKDLLYFHVENILENRKIRSDLTSQNVFEFYFGGVRYHLPMKPVQITDLLLSTYSSATARNFEYNEAHHELNIIKSELNAKNDELERVKQQKNHLMDIAQNYLRGSLTTLKGDCTYLMSAFSDKMDKEALAVINRIKDTSDSMLSLISEFLNVSVVESLDIRLNLRKQNLTAIIQQNLELNEKLALKKDIRLQFVAEENIPEIPIDSYRFEHVLNILIDNAVKYSLAGSTVEIRLSKTKSEIVLSVKNQGKGLSAAQIDKLFGLYERFSRKGSAEEGSSGLSLAIAKNIISEHRGRIWVESEEGKGAIFWIALPIPQDSISNMTT